MLYSSETLRSPERRYRKDAAVASWIVMIFIFMVALIAGWAPAVTAQEATPPAPIVQLSDGHRRTCKVYLGDQMPTAGLPDLDGKVVQSQSLLGEELTLIVFWDTRSAYARELYRHLDRDVVSQYGEQGLTVITVNRGDELATMQPFIKKYGGKHIELRDPSRALWNQVATDLIPRSYLVDSKGKIIWMDIAYSVGSRREMLYAIDFYLAD